MKSRILNGFFFLILVLASTASMPVFAELGLGHQDLEEATAAARRDAGRNGHPSVTSLHVLAKLLERATEKYDSTTKDIFSQLGLGPQVLKTKLDEVNAQLAKLNTASPTAVDTENWEETRARMKEIAEITGKGAGIPELLYVILDGEDEPGTKDAAEALKNLEITPAKLEKAFEFKGVASTRFVQDLTKMAGEDRGIQERTWVQDPTVFKSRIGEVNTVLASLATGNKRILVLTGESGIGKTAIIQQAARLISLKDPTVPKSILDANPSLLRVDMEEIVRSAKSKSDEVLLRLERVLDDLAKNPNAIVAIDNLNAVAKLKLSNGTELLPEIYLQVTSPRRGNRYLLAGADIQNSLKSAPPSVQEQEIREPEKPDLNQMLNAQRERIERIWKVRIPRHILADIVSYSERYLKRNAQPGIAISLMEEAAALMAFDIELQKEAAPPELLQVQRNKIQQIRDRIEEVESYAEVGDLSAARKRELAELQNKLETLSSDLAKMETAYSEAQRLARTLDQYENDEKRPITDPDVINAREQLQEVQREYHFFYRQLSQYHLARVIQNHTRIPIKEILVDSDAKIESLEADLEKRLVGQYNAKPLIRELLRRKMAGVQDKTRPIIFVLLGPTGVGKTYLTDIIAEIVYSDKLAKVPIIMGNLGEATAPGKMLGAAAGYTGHGEGNLLDPILNRPNSVVILDEYEKGHRSIDQILLNILDEGYTIDSQGRKLDFRNAIICLTMNLGADIVSDMSLTYEERKAKLVELMIEHFGKPEFVARMGDPILLEPFTEEELKQVFEMEWKKWFEKRREEPETRYLQIVTTERAKDQIEDIATRTASQGARFVRQFVEKNLESALVDGMTNSKLKAARNNTGIIGIDFEPALDTFFAGIPTDENCNKWLRKLEKGSKAQYPAVDDAKIKEAKDLEAKAQEAKAQADFEASRATPEQLAELNKAVAEKGAAVASAAQPTKSPLPDMAEIQKKLSELRPKTGEQPPESSSVILTPETPGFSQLVNRVEQRGQIRAPQKIDPQE